mgnify:FL=1
MTNAAKMSVTRSIVPGNPNKVEYVGVFNLSSYYGSFSDALWEFSDKITELSGTRPDLVGVKVSHDKQYRANGFRLVV